MQGYAWMAHMIVKWSNKADHLFVPVLQCCEIAL